MTETDPEQPQPTQMTNKLWGKKDLERHQKVTKRYTSGPAYVVKRTYCTTPCNGAVQATLRMSCTVMAFSQKTESNTNGKEQQVHATHIALWSATGREHGHQSDGRRTVGARTMVRAGGAGMVVMLGL